MYLLSLDYTMASLVNIPYRLEDKTRYRKETVVVVVIIIFRSVHFVSHLPIRM